LCMQSGRRAACWRSIFLVVQTIATSCPIRSKRIRLLLVLFGFFRYEKVSRLLAANHSRGRAFSLPFFVSYFALKGEMMPFDE
jgi:hypothetical protein